MTKKLSGKTAIVLGVAPGNVGHAIARRFVDDGAAVLIAGRRPDALASVAEDIGAQWQQCDITSESDLDALVATALERLGRIDVGVNATGWGLLTPFEDTTREDLEKMAAVQFTGPFQLFQRLVANMADGGSIIQISSVTASIMFENHAAYMGTKAGIDHVIRCVANEYGHRGIRANSIAPGGVADAPMSGGGLNYPPIRSLYLREIPLGRVGVAEDVANVAAWLAGDESAFVTGQVVQVSGGQTLRRNPSIADLAGAISVEQA
ncbi:SDR family NAD(P)-dependent oxidoreductase [Rhodococcus sp. TAF43]|uniref:SDR family NAD(P)-dependent oxidoreductase n=1 Tax=unclassified Rhodococcus (in: high G+C Gram-positive bacteria) TaxID=192944 RepID=UPI0015824B18|nr:SDR family oxidoreductase [Rhodococcus sp. W8901]QKT13785.1 SDR family oxidoreductase [Rhodococcus sp. W8901]